MYPHEKPEHTYVCEDLSTEITPKIAWLIDLKRSQDYSDRVYNIHFRD